MLQNDHNHILWGSIYTSTRYIGICGELWGRLHWANHLYNLVFYGSMFPEVDKQHVIELC